MIKRLEGLKPKMIVQTHGHVDHCVGSSSLARRWYSHRHARIGCAPIQSIPQQIQAFMGGAVRPEMFDLVTPEILLNEGDEIAVGSITAKVFTYQAILQGVSPCISKRSWQAFCGDTLFADGSRAHRFVGRQLANSPKFHQKQDLHPPRPDSCLQRPRT